MSRHFDRNDDELERKQLIARHSGANDAKFFGWEDVAQLSAHKLALVFVERFPQLARATYHFDFAYAGWFATLLAHCEYGYLPYLFAEYEEEIGVMRMRQFGQVRTVHKLDYFPLPPSPSCGNRLDPHPKPKWLE
ncbi:MAG: hypothetical protein D6754_13275 [Alphaproteobacteria bacterium]|nr:MAG: hypothetical protein D6754_13275 [Alphaproteobacteria bacterium]